MGKATGKKFVPRWLTQKPTDDEQQLIKTYSYDYIQGLALQNQSIDKPTELIPPYLEILKDHNEKFGKLKPHYKRTTYAWYEFIRQELKNSITKV